MAEKVTEKNSGLAYQQVLTNSATHGIVRQSEYFDRIVAGKNHLDAYYVVNPNDYVYNPRISKEAPCGPINRNTLELTGIASPLYLVFRVSSQSLAYEFLDQYFKTANWFNYMKLQGNSGARSDRFTIADTDFFSMPVRIPSLPEQRRIGDFFSTLDNLIAAAERQEALLRQKKQAYLQLMFPQDGETEPRLRFQEFSDSWERHQLGEVIRPIKVIPVSRYSRHGRFPVIQQGDHPIAGYSSDEPYFQYSNVVLFGDHTLSLYRPESPFLLASDGLKVLSCDFPGNDFLYAMLERYKPSNEGYKRHFSILKKQHCSFPSLPEQRRIGGFFSTLDNLIAAAEQRAESLRALKSAYLQRMFA